MSNQILIGDCRSTLATLPAGLFHCAITSPPYWGLRSYLSKDHPDKGAEIGSEATPDLFIQTMVDVFRAVRRVLRDDGTLWVNLGDTYCDGTKWGGRTGGKHVKELHGQAVGRERVAAGMKAGDLCNMPHRVAAALQADGWYWRSTIIWAKRSPMPESVSGWRWRRCRVKVGACPVPRRGVDGNQQAEITIQNNAKWTPCPGCDKCRPNGGYVLRKGRWPPTTGHEYIFLFSKSADYFCDGDAVQEMCSVNTHSKGTNRHHKNGQQGVERTNRDFQDAIGDSVQSRNPRTVWMLSSEPYKGAHFATFPTEIPRRCILAGTSPQCCGACGSPYAPVVESERVATRPGEDCKILTAHANRTDIDPATNWQHSTLNYGNRDPQRHVAVSKVTGYKPTCGCFSGAVVAPEPCRVLDPFGGSGTTAQVARALGRDWTICELSAEYAELAKARIDTPPRFMRQGNRGGASSRRGGDGQRLLFEMMEAMIGIAGIAGRGTSG